LAVRLEDRPFLIGHEPVGQLTAVGERREVLTWIVGRELAGLPLDHVGRRALPLGNCASEVPYVNPEPQGAITTFEPNAGLAVGDHPQRLRGLVAAAEHGERSIEGTGATAAHRAAQALAERITQIVTRSAGHWHGGIANVLWRHGSEGC